MPDPNDRPAMTPGDWRCAAMMAVAYYVVLAFAGWCLSAPAPLPRRPVRPSELPHPAMLSKLMWNGQPYMLTLNACGRMTCGPFDDSCATASSAGPWSYDPAKKELTVKEEFTGCCTSMTWRVTFIDGVRKGTARVLSRGDAFGEEKVDAGPEIPVTLEALK